MGIWSGRGCAGGVPGGRETADCRCWLWVSRPGPGRPGGFMAPGASPPQRPRGLCHVGLLHRAMQRGPARNDWRAQRGRGRAELRDLSRLSAFQRIRALPAGGGLRGRPHWCCSPRPPAPPRSPHSPLPSVRREKGSWGGCSLGQPLSLHLGKKRGASAFPAGVGQARVGRPASVPGVCFLGVTVPLEVLCRGLDEPASSTRPGLPAPSTEAPGPGMHRSVCSKPSFPLGVGPSLTRLQMGLPEVGVLQGDLGG